MHPREPVLAKNVLKSGAYYRGICRNAQEARWDGYHECFIHWRTKFSFKFLECICHPDDDDVFDVFYPYEEIKSIDPFEWKQVFSAEPGIGLNLTEVRRKQQGK